MKKIAILTVAMLYLTMNANSQLTKGNWLVGGNINFSYATNKSEASSRNNVTIIGISPNGAYFFADKLAAGIRVGVNLLSQKAIGTERSLKYNTYGFGPFLRYYFLPTSKQVNIIAEGSYQYGLEKGEGSKITKNTFSFAAGPAVYLNQSVAVEFLIGYSTYKYVHYAGSNASIQAGIGLQIHLEREK